MLGVKRNLKPTSVSFSSFRLRITSHINENKSVD